MLYFLPTEFFKLRIWVKHHRRRHLCLWQLTAIFCTCNYVVSVLQLWRQFISSHFTNMLLQPTTSHVLQLLLTTGKVTDQKVVANTVNTCYIKKQVFMRAPYIMETTCKCNTIHEGMKVIVYEGHRVTVNRVPENRTSPHITAHQPHITSLWA